MKSISIDRIGYTSKSIDENEKCFATYNMHTIISAATCMHLLQPNGDNCAYAVSINFTRVRGLDAYP